MKSNILRLVIISFVAATVSSPSAAAPSVSRTAVVNAAKSKVTENFLDPTGAQLRNVTVWNVGKQNSMFQVCGEINGKNSYGAFTGFKRFYAMVTTTRGLKASVSYLEGTSAGNDYVVGESCKEGKYKLEWKM